MAVSRRRFLVGAAAAGGAVAAGGFAAPRAIAVISLLPLWRQADTLPRSASARDIGVEYLRRYPDEAETAHEAERMAAILGRFTSGGSTEQQAARIRAMIQRDLEIGDVVWMGGWMLSKTGVRLYAFAAAKAETATGVAGVFAPQDAPDGVRFSWMTPAASFRVPAAGGSVAFRLRSGAPFDQRVHVTLNDVPTNELVISGPAWHDARHALPRGAGDFVDLRLRTTSVWKPDNDFRTLGVGIALTPWASWT